MSKYTKVIPDDIEQTLGWFLKYLKRNKKLLDVGCSTGYFGKFIKENYGLIVDGVEISEDKIEAKKVLDNVYSFDLDGDWPQSVTNKKYDYIFFGDVLEHLKNPYHSLEAAKSILNKNGFIFVSIPNIAHISTRLELLNGSFQYEGTGILDSTHLQYFTLNTFSQLVTDCNLSILELNYSYNDFPEKIIKELLQKAGVSAKDKFWKMANSKESRAYQYKFVLQKSNSSKNKTKFISLIDKPEHFRDSFIEDMKSQIRALKKHADEQAKIIDNQDKQIKKLESQFTTLRKIKSSVSKIVKKKR